MKRVLFLSIVLLHLFCDRDSDNQSAGEYSQKKHREFIESSETVTLENVFGNEHNISDDDYLLAEPTIIVAGYNNDIFIVDEGRIKVFYPNGKEKTIIGSQGEGPGEFGRNFVPFLSPEGYLTVMDCGGMGYSNEGYSGSSRLVYLYNVFAPDYSFITKRRFQSNENLLDFLSSKEIEFSLLTGRDFFTKRGIRETSIRRFYFLNNNEKLYGIVYHNPDLISDTKYIVEVLYENNGKFVSLYSGISFDPPGSSSSRYPLGEFKWDVLPRNRIICINTADDIFDLEGESTYTIQVISFNNEIKKAAIKHKFTPVELPESMFQNRDYSGMPSRMRKRMEKRAEDSREKVYFASVNRIRVDGDFAFVFLFSARNGDSQVNSFLQPRIVDIFDLNKMEYIKTVEFPFIPMVIRNGFAYIRNGDEKGFAVVEKYKIDPATYGK
jgi:hypothetical protein